MSFSPSLDFLSTLPHLSAGEKLLLVVFLATGLVFFYLSFTSRHGRSRWPLHGIMALGIIAAGTGAALLPGRVLVALMSFTPPGGPSAPIDPTSDPAIVAQWIVSPGWFGFATIVLGALALTRVVYGMVREPGPRF